jgi:hypothetical protein
MYSTTCMLAMHNLLLPSYLQPLLQLLLLLLLMSADVLQQHGSGAELLPLLLLPLRHWQLTQRQLP